jgi:glycosyltransferase involved in cell wall biosynthesis
MVLMRRKIANVGFGINAQFYEEEKDYNNHLMLIVLRKGTEYVKGLYLLLDAFEKLKKRIPDAQLAVVGTECRAINGVQYYYNQPREKTLGLFRECTLYVMPNILEPNGITYLEALANKAPIVGLDRFSVPEFSGYGKWGFYIKDEDPDQLADLLEEALSNPKRLEVMGLQGQKFVHERYTWDQTASEIWERMF